MKQVKLKQKPCPWLLMTNDDDPCNQKVIEKKVDIMRLTFMASGN